MNRGLLDTPSNLPIGRAIVTELECVIEETTVSRRYIPILARVCCDSVHVSIFTIVIVGRCSRVLVEVYWQERICRVEDPC